MKRWVFFGALSLPLPFAMLPLVSITLNSSAAPEPGNGTVTLEVSEPAAAPVSEKDSGSMGFRIESDAPEACQQALFHDS